MYLFNTVKYILLMYKPKELETFFIEVNNPKESNSVIGVVYRHPCMDEGSFTGDYMKPLNDKLSNENKKVFLAGDYNYDLLNMSTHNEPFNFFETMMSNFLLPLITIPRKIYSVYNTLIDNILTNQLDPDMISDNLTVGISDHLPSFMILPKQKQNHLPKNNNIYSRTTKNFGRENFILDYFDIN